MGHQRASLGHVEQVDPEHLGDPLYIAAGEARADPDHQSRALDLPQLRRPPPIRRRLGAAFVVERRLARPGPLRGRVRGAVEHRVLALLDRLAGRADRRDRPGAVRHVPARVQGEGDLVHDAPHDGEREARPGLPGAPVIEDDPAADIWFAADASVRDIRHMLVTHGPVRRGHEGTGGREAWPEVRWQRR
jgi:hypothetical protein